jgi:3-hydroxybutyryl-CoA dehydrogenase
MPRTRTKHPDKAIPAGVVGAGLMGASIAACLLAAGHPVVAVEVDRAKRRTAKSRLLALLRESKEEGLLKRAPESMVARFRVDPDYSALRDSQLVFESIIEDLQAKKSVIRSVEAVVAKTALIASNTSAIPITLLQQDAFHPERVIGIHWGEPAHVNRFMEITCGERTDPAHARRVSALARLWGKEPSILRRDIRGFITNRVMYAMIREAFHLVESGVATIADVDRSLRNDLGYWITFAGPFRFMDLTGIPAYAAVMRDLLPELSASTELPELMRKVAGSGAQGVSNAKGFYNYTPAQAKRWERLFRKFSYEIRALSMKYPEDIGDRVKRR